MSAPRIHKVLNQKASHIPTAVMDELILSMGRQLKSPHDFGLALRAMKSSDDPRLAALPQPLNCLCLLITADDERLDSLADGKIRPDHTSTHVFVCMAFAEEEQMSLEKEIDVMTAVFGPMLQDAVIGPPKTASSATREEMKKRLIEIIQADRNAKNYDAEGMADSMVSIPGFAETFLSSEVEAASERMAKMVEEMKKGNDNN